MGACHPQLCVHVARTFAEEARVQLTQDTVGRLVGALGAGWNERSPADLVRLYAPDAVVVYAADTVLRGIAEIEAWITAAQAARADMRLSITPRAWTGSTLCVEYVNRFADADGTPRALVGAEVLLVATDGAAPRIARQHIYPAQASSTSPLVAAAVENAHDPDHGSGGTAWSSATT
jgi:hypothetical protein